MGISRVILEMCLLGQVLSSGIVSNCYVFANFTPATPSHGKFYLLVCGCQTFVFEGGFISGRRQIFTDGCHCKSRKGVALFTLFLAVKGNGCGGKRPITKSVFSVRHAALQSINWS